MEGIDLMTESIAADLSFMAEMSLDLISESGNDNAFKRFIDWVIEKIKTFVDFIMNIFKKKRKEQVAEEINEVKEEVKKKTKSGKFKPFTIPDTFPILFEGPEAAYDKLDKFLDKYLDAAYKVTNNYKFGFGSDESIPTMAELRADVWKEAVQSLFNYKSDSITKDVIDSSLGHRRPVEITSTDQIENFNKSSLKLYDLADQIKKRLEERQNRLKDINDPEKSFTEIAKVEVTLDIEVYGTVVKWVDQEIVKTLAHIKAHVKS
jgi:hypothetical protein